MEGVHIEILKIVATLDKATWIEIFSEQIKNFGYLENRISSSSAPTLYQNFIRTLSITQSFPLQIFFHLHGFND